MWLIQVDLHISENVVDEVRKGVCGFCTHHPYAADKRAVHCPFNESEDVFYPASRPGLETVVSLLVICQRVVAMTFLADDRIHATFFHDVFLCLISCIQVQVLSLVFILNEGLDDIGVMDTRVCGVVLLYELGLPVSLDMVLVTIVVFRRTYIVPWI